MDQLPFLLNHLATCIERSYGLRIRRIVPLPLGHAGATWIFRAETDRDTYFVKVKQSLPETGIRVSQQLLGMGVPVAVPLDSQSGTPWAQCDGLYLLLFPFIGGRPFEAETARSEQWKNLGAVLSRIHSASLPPSLLDVLEKETFLPYGSGFLKKVETAASSHVALPEFRHLWRDSRGLMAEFFARVQELGEDALRSNPTWCLCHGDFQAGNILQTESDGLVIVDWDAPVWSPPQIDLMFVEPRYRASLEEGYGPSPKNPSVDAYLSSNWLLQEAFDCIDRIVFSMTADTEEKAWAMKMLQDLVQKMRLATASA
jgi:spectinomycin phosphotransferase